MRYRAFTLLVAALSLCVTAVLTAQDASSDSAHSTAAHANSHVIVTPDQIKWSDAPPGLPPGAKICVIDGDPFAAGPYVLRVKSPAGYVVPPHWHSQDEHITVLSGKFAIGEGDKLDKSATTTLGPGGYANMPAKMHHYAYTDTEAIFQVHGTGPFDIHYINPADDPRGAAGTSPGASSGAK